MRIALLTHSVLPRGGVVHTLELAEALTARGHAVSVLAPVEPGQRLFRATRAQFVPLPLRVPAGTLVQQVGQRIAGLTEALPAALARVGPLDLLHAQDSLSGNALATLQRGRGLPPWVRTVHHLDDFAEPQLAAWQARAWQSARAVACVSDSWCHRLLTEHGVRAERLFNGVDLARFRPDPLPGDAALPPELMDGAPVCLAVGGVEQRKNSVRLLQAFASLRLQDPAWAAARLVIAGGASLLDHGSTQRGWLAALQASGLREGPGEAVQRLGPVDDALLPALMRRASVLAMPSLVEGFGLVALEALACGTPVLVSQRAPFTEHLAGQPGVAWCEPEDVASIAQGLQQAATLPRQHTPPPVCLAHSWARSAERHEAWYARVLALAPRRGRTPVPLT